MGEMGIALAGGALHGFGIGQEQAQQRQIEKQELKLRQDAIKNQEAMAGLQMQKFLAELGRGVSLGKGQRLVNPFTGEQMGPGGGESDLGALEFQAEQKAIPFDLTKSEERSSFATRAGQVGELTPLQQLQQVRPPMERVPQGAESRFFFETMNQLTSTGMPEDQALREATARLAQFREQQAVAGAAGKARGEQRPDVPIKLKDLMLFGKPVGTTFGQVAGETPATPQMQEEITQLDNATAVFETLAAAADRVITADTPAQAVAQGIRLTSGAFARTDPVAAAYSDQQQQFLGILSRTLGGERGVLTDRDIGRIVGGLPRFRDTKAIKDFKLKTMRNILETAVRAKMRVITRQPSGETRQKIEGFLTDLEKASAQAGPQQPQGQPSRIRPRILSIEPVQ